MVGITAFTSNINRAYEIAEGYKNRKIKVVIGGIHASMNPSEASFFSDSVVIGEAENVWGSVLKDFEKNGLKKKYIGPRVDLGSMELSPRRELLNKDYIWQPIQTSRGCPYNCNFCSVTKYLGHKYRKRNPEKVLAEIESLGGDYISFVDDNLIGHSNDDKNRAKQIFKGMTKGNSKKKWWMQTSINASDDEETISLAAEAGCMFAFIGFETIDKNTLARMRKGINLSLGISNYKKVVRLFHKYGIAVLGSFIIGNDFESPEYYRQLKKFLISSEIDIIQITILTPLPGTDLMRRFQLENRLLFNNFPQDWDKYRFSYIVHKPVGLDTETIYAANNYIKKHLYSFPNYQFRIIRSLLNLKNLAGFSASVRFNRALKMGWKHSHYYENCSPKHFDFHD